MTEPKETNEEINEELTSEELESVCGGIIEFTTTDNQKLVWNVKENTMSYNHKNRPSQEIKISKINRIGLGGQEGEE